MAERFVTRAVARTAILEWMETFYNRRGLHSTNGHRSPVEYEAHTCASRDRSGEVIARLLPTLKPPPRFGIRGRQQRRADCSPRRKSRTLSTGNEKCVLIEVNSAQVGVVRRP